MRLIDADKLKEHCKHDLENVVAEHYPDKIVEFAKATTDGFCKNIDEQETVDAIPVSWIKTQMEKLRDSGFPTAEFGAAGIMALLDMWEKFT